MADKKISALTGATTPLAGTEVLPIVQSGSTVKVAVSDLTAGRTVGTGALNTTGKITVNLDGATGLRLNNTTGGAGQGIEMLTAATKYSFLLGAQYNVNDGFEITPSTAAGGTTFTTPAFKLEYAGGGVFNAAIGTGNLSFANGKGIDFSATPGTGTSELLADYEEGTWTLGISGMTLTGGTNIAKYTKVGRQVTVQVELSDVTLSGTPSGTITGLPFANSTGRSSTSGVSYRFAFNNLSNNVVGIVLSGSTNIAFVSMNSGLSWTDANFVATSVTLNFTATYFV